MKPKFKYTGLALLGLIAPTILFAQEVAAVAVPEPVPFIDSGNTAWMIVATALVMLMTIPGLALFYGGLVRQKNILNIL
ncbi:MAG: ammonia channel protein, partial [Bacteroidota bacterium]|nr:ammonia channel protein [Bacteroidota bacterium]